MVIISITGTITFPVIIIVIVIVIVIRALPLFHACISQRSSLKTLNCLAWAQVHHVIGQASRRSHLSLSSLEMLLFFLCSLRYLRLLVYLYFFLLKRQKGYHCMALLILKRQWRWGKADIKKCVRPTCTFILYRTPVSKKGKN